MRTFTAGQLVNAELSWIGFSDEWASWRRLAAERGIIFPPSGTALDLWNDEAPSQRALLIRAIRETPLLLRKAIARSHSWTEVLGHVLGGRDVMLDSAARREVEADALKRELSGTREETRALLLSLGWKE